MNQPAQVVWGSRILRPENRWGGFIIYLGGRLITLGTNLFSALAWLIGST